MKRIDDVLGDVKHLIDQPDLEDFIARGWVRPLKDDVDYFFDDMDIARIQLVCELHIEMKFEIDAVDLILSLVDQLHESRMQIDKLMVALKQQQISIESSKN